MYDMPGGWCGIGKAALEYLRVAKEEGEKHINAARKTMVEAQKRLNIHKKTHKKMRESATK
jgi:hypothetical protein